MPHKLSIPSLRCHKPSGRAVVTLNSKDFYVGAWPDADSPAPPEAEAAYGELVARWLAGGRKPLVDATTGAACSSAGSLASGLSIGEALLRYLDHGRELRATARPRDARGHWQHVPRPRPGDGAADDSQTQRARGWPHHHSRAAADTGRRRATGRGTSGPTDRPPQRTRTGNAEVRGRGRAAGRRR
jgi:hypothetical protein